VEIYKISLECHLTEEAYKCIRSSSFFSDSLLPARLKNVKKKMMNLVEKNFLPCINNTFDFDSYRAPGMSVFQAINIWISIPSFLQAIREKMATYLPANLVDESLYDALESSRLDSITFGTHLYRCTADGSEYLSAVRQNIPKFRAQYEKALDEGVETLVLSLGFYEDGFMKNLDSKVNLTLFCLTLRKLSLNLSFY
jgi:hypothetical protein